MKYLLILLFMIPGMSINANPLQSDVTVEAGVVNKTLDVDDVVVSEPESEPLNVPVEDIHGICDTDCQKSEPIQLENKSVIPVVPATVVKSTSPKAAITPTKKGKKVKKSSTKQPSKPKVDTSVITSKTTKSVTVKEVPTCIPVKDKHKKKK